MISMRRIHSKISIISFVISIFIYSFLNHNLIVYGLVSLFVLFGALNLYAVISELMYDEYSPEILEARIKNIERLKKEMKYDS